MIFAVLQCPSKHPWDHFSINLRRQVSHLHVQQAIVVIKTKYMYIILSVKYYTTCKFTWAKDSGYQQGGDDTDTAVYSVIEFLVGDPY